MSGALAPKFDPTRRCRTVELWPTPDQLAWEAALQPGDVLEPGGPASQWAPVTQHGVVKSYGRWLTWLDNTGQLDLNSPPAGQVTPQRVAAFRTALETVNAPRTVLFRVIGLAQAARVLAPGQDWSWLWNLVARLQRTAKPVRLKRPRLVGVDELFALGQHIMGEAEQGRFSGWRRASHYRDGLMIALLAARPLRMKNFIAIEIGRHLVIDGEHYRLEFAKGETKNRKSLKLPFPELLRPALDHYLGHYRPMLLERRRVQKSQSACAGLWISKAGRPMSHNGVYGRIVELTRVGLGQAVNPHLFRDCAATSIADDDPEHVRTTAAVLGHTSLATSERHYNHAKSLQSVQRYQAGMLALRRRRGWHLSIPDPAA